MPVTTDTTHEERPVWIALNGVRRIVLSCSPVRLDALALGHLVAEGWVDSADDVADITVEQDGASGPPGTRGVFVVIDENRIRLVESTRAHQTSNGCGLRHVLDCDPESVGAVPRGRIPDDPAQALRDLFVAVNAAAPDGGVHGVGIHDGTHMRAVAFDIARHCAVDRAIGLGLQGGDTSGLGLVCTARISGAIALKAVRARLGWIASRSIATSLALEIAGRFGLVIVERAGRRHE